MGGVVEANEEPLSDEDSQDQENVTENARYLANGEGNSAPEDKCMNAPSVESIPHGELTHVLIRTCNWLTTCII